MSCGKGLSENLLNTGDVGGNGDGVVVEKLTV